MATKPAATCQLYESDFALWLEDQAAALKERRAAALDWDNLAEEIEGLARSDQRALRSFLRNALLHMLELAYWEAEWERNRQEWYQHLMNARDGMVSIIEDSPSLERYLAEVFEESYQYACRRAEDKIGRPLPNKSEWTLEQIRDDTFYPGPTISSAKTRRM